MNSRQHLWIGSAATTAALAAAGASGWALPMALVIPLTARAHRAHRWGWIGGVIAVAYVASATPAGALTVIAAALGLWAAVFPDLDHHAAPGGRWGLHWAWKAVTWMGTRCVGANRWAQHRGLTHTMLALTTSSLAVAVLSWIAAGHPHKWSGWILPALAWTAGYTSHLVADSTTPSGVRWGLATPSRLGRTPRGRLVRPHATGVIPHPSLRTARQPMR